MKSLISLLLIISFTSCSSILTNKKNIEDVPLFPLTNNPNYEIKLLDSVQDIYIGFNNNIFIDSYDFKDGTLRKHKKTLYDNKFNKLFTIYEDEKSIFSYEYIEKYDLILRTEFDTLNEFNKNKYAFINYKDSTITPIKEFIDPHKNVLLDFKYIQENKELDSILDTLYSKNKELNEIKETYRINNGHTYGSDDILLIKSKTEFYFHTTKNGFEKKRLDTEGYYFGQYLRKIKANEIFSKWYLDTLKCNNIKNYAYKVKDTVSYDHIRGHIYYKYKIDNLTVKFKYWTELNNFINKPKRKWPFFQLNQNKNKNGGYLLFDYENKKLYEIRKKI